MDKPKLNTSEILPIGKFTGYQVVAPTLSDWIMGQETGITAAVAKLSSSDWRPFLPTPKKQLMIVDGIVYGDTESCTNFSATNELATYLQMLLDTNQIHISAKQFLNDEGYIDVSGKVNLSPRFSAITSGTTGANGNNQPKVWQTLRTVGIVPEADCPTPINGWRAKINAGLSKDTDLWKVWFDHTAVTPASLAKAKRFLDHFVVQYQWVAYPGLSYTATTLKNALQTSPLNIATAVCSGWNTQDPIQGCGAGTAHATTMTKVEPTCYDIFDHYNPFQKQFALNYNITYAMQGIAVVKATTVTTYPPPANFKHNFTTQLDYGSNSPEVIFLQDALKTDGVFPLTVQNVAHFGNATLLALQLFQKKYGIASGGTPQTTGYGRVGPATLVKLNSLYNK